MALAFTDFCLEVASFLHAMRTFMRYPLVAMNVLAGFEMAVFLDELWISFLVDSLSPPQEEYRDKNTRRGKRDLGS